MADGQISPDHVMQEDSASIEGSDRSGSARRRHAEGMLGRGSQELGGGRPRNGVTQIHEAARHTGNAKEDG